MRIRYKPWARPELEASSFYIDNPQDFKGKWKTVFKNPDLPINLELGCGKGQFISIMDEKDKIDRIYINFCNPWPKGKHRKKRLTHTRQLEKYKTFLKDGGEIYFKTDDDDLFVSSLTYFEEAGFKVRKKTFDLHNEENFWEDIENIETEHEKMFSSEGIKIKALIAKK